MGPQWKEKDMPCQTPEGDPFGKEATRLLCRLCQRMEVHDGKISTYAYLWNDMPGLSEWWEKHQKRDRGRLRRTALLAQELLSKDQWEDLCEYFKRVH